MQPQPYTIDPASPAASDYTQRWRAGQHSWRHISEGGFLKTRYDVAAIDEQAARSFVLEHHYSASYPASRFRFGLHESGLLVGVAVLSVPVAAAVLTSTFPDLEPYDEALELGRLVLLDRVPANAESWFLARVWELAAAQGIQGVVSFSDPLPRLAADGSQVMPGHVGTIYQASNAAYLGRATARTLYLLPDGTVLNERAVQKVRSQVRGHEYVERQLVALGAEPRGGEEPHAWLRRALDQARVRRVRHQGNHRYAFTLGRRRRSVRVAHPARPLSYPKQPDLDKTAVAR